jgi:hypothetical protein
MQSSIALSLPAVAAKREGWVERYRNPTRTLQTIRNETMKKTTRHWIATGLLAGLVFGTPLMAETPTYEEEVNQRIHHALDLMQQKCWKTPAKNSAFYPAWAATLLYQSDKVEKANQQILDYCALAKQAGTHQNRRPSLSLLQIYLVKQTYDRLTLESRQAIEDYAWDMLPRMPTFWFYNCSQEDAGKPFWEFNSSENVYVEARALYLQLLAVLRRSERYGPEKLFAGKTIESQYQAWVQFWIGYFRDRAMNCLDLEVAHYGSYGLVTMGCTYMVHDATDNPELRKLAANFITLYLAEVASEYEPRTGNRAWAGSRMHMPYGITYWTRMLLCAYGWNQMSSHYDNLLSVTFLISDYRPPEILRAIAGNPDRGEYLSTSRRHATVEDIRNKKIVFDENGDSFFRRDVWFTPDYTLSTMTLDPGHEYDVHIAIAQTTGVTFASDERSRISVLGRGFYASRATMGITGPAVSIIARDPKAGFGLARFVSNNNRVFLSNGPLWDNRVEDPSGWFFTRIGEAYAAIFIPDGYQVSDKGYEWPNRQIKEVEETAGHYLDLNDMWAPVILQMGRAKDYKSFEAFQMSVKENRFEWEEGEDLSSEALAKEEHRTLNTEHSTSNIEQEGTKNGSGKLTYTSEAGDTYEVWAKFPQLPKINGETLNLNPEYTYNSPYLKMKHGSNKAVISYPGYEDVVLEF